MWDWIKRHYSDLASVLAIGFAIAIFIVIIYAQLQFAATGETNFVCRFFNSCHKVNINGQ